LNPELVRHLQAGFTLSPLLSMSNRSASPKPTGKADEAKDAGPGGLPEVDPKGFIKFLPVFIGLLIIPRAIGYGIALAIYKYGKTSLYDKNIAKLGEDVGYLYIAAVLLGFLSAWLNNYPMMYKTMIMRQNSANLRANMMFYKEAGGKADSPYVVLETEGPVGAYNRANRSLTHFTENSLSVFVCALLAGYIFPFPTMVLTAIFALGRILHQVGYSSPKGYGAHGPGFALSAVSTLALEMLCLLVAMKTPAGGLGGIAKAFVSGGVMKSPGGGPGEL